MSGEFEEPEARDGTILLKKEGIVVIVPLGSVWAVYWFEGVEEKEPGTGKRFGLKDWTA